MHCFRLALLGALITLTLAAVPAHAQPAFMPDAPDAPAPATRVRKEHYGITVATADVAGVATALATEEPAIFYSSYLLAGPIVHLFHGNYGTAAGSLGLRLALPMVGYMLGRNASDCGDFATYDCGSDYRIHGLLIGAGSALLFDWLVLATKTTREPAEQPALLRAGSLRANPGLQVSHTGSMLLGLDGNF